MDALLVLFAAAVGVAGLLASIAIWAPRRTTIRAVSVALAGVFIPVVYLGLTEVLSKPKPMQHEWFQRHVDEATVLGVSVDEGKAIYLWLRLDESLEPRYYVLPWQRRLAERLEDVIDEAMRDEAHVRLRNPFSRRGFDDLGELGIEIVRPPTPPSKRPPPPAGFFNPRERSI